MLKYGVPAGLLKACLYGGKVQDVMGKRTVGLQIQSNDLSLRDFLHWSHLFSVDIICIIVLLTTALSQCL